MDDKTWLSRYLKHFINKVIHIFCGQLIRSRDTPSHPFAPRETLSMNLTEWLSIASICLLGAMSPGPSLTVVARHAVQQGQRAGIVAALSHGLAVTLYATLAVSGLHLIVSGSALIYSILQSLGAGFLCYLGLQALRSAVRGDAAPLLAQPPQLRRAAMDGFAVAFLNPKLALFFLALFSQFLSANTSSSEKAIMVATMGAIDAGWYCLTALLLTRPSRLARLRQQRRLLDAVFGILLFGLGLSVFVRAL